jgi:hypothetical protein
MTAKFLPIIEALVVAPEENPEDVEELKSRLKHLAICVRYVAGVLGTCSDRFNPHIRHSIAVMGENLMWIVSDGLEEQKIKQIAFSLQDRHILTAQMQTRMLQNGWYPSDLAKCRNNIHSVRALHLMSKIDKSQLQRGHSICTHQFCTTG